MPGGDGVGECNITIVEEMRQRRRLHDPSGRNRQVLMVMVTGINTSVVPSVIKDGNRPPAGSRFGDARQDDDGGRVPFEGWKEGFGEDLLQGFLPRPITPAPGEKTGHEREKRQERDARVPIRIHCG